MTYFHPAALEHRRKYFTRPNGKLWMRPNANLWIRHEAYRFMPPGSPRYVGKDVVRYCPRRTIRDTRATAPSRQRNGRPNMQNCCR